MRWFFVSLILGLSVWKVDAQQQDLINAQVEERLEMAVQEVPDAEEKTIPESLESYFKRPLNLYNVSSQEMRKSGLFSESQISAFTSYVQTHGQIMDITELKRINGFTIPFIRDILPFVRCEYSMVSGKNVGDLLSNGDHYLIYKVYRVLEEKSGYAYGANSAYHGSPFGSMLRYRYSFKNNLLVNITAEKDPGEPVFDEESKQGFDFYSMTIGLRNIGSIKTLVAGDFQASYGQGLTFASAPDGFSQDPVYLKKNYRGIQPYTSSGEGGFQRGFAGAVRVSRVIAVELFCSKRKLDGNLRSAEDSLYEENSVSAFQTSGYHRTWYEIQNKAQVNETITGGHLGFTSKKLSIGITAVNISFDHLFRKNLQPYNQFDFSGRRMIRSGVDFSWITGNLILFGEVAAASESAHAIVAGFTLSAGKGLSFSAAARNYTVNYLPLYTSGIGARSVNANERGIACGITLNLSRTFMVNASYDIFEYPWLVYDATKPVTGSYLKYKFLWKPTRKSEVYFSGRVYNREITSVNPVQPSLPESAFRIRVNSRIHAGYPLTVSIAAKTRIEFVRFTEGKKYQQGVMFLQDFSWKPKSSRWQLTLRIATFDTDNYDTRIYAFENDVPASYSMPAYYYKGNRYFFLVRFKASSVLSVWAKYGWFIYDNRNYIGSGYERIEGNRKSEIRMLVKYEFE